MKSNRLAASLLACCATTTYAQTPAPGIAFINVNVVAVDEGRILPRRTVLVRDGRIAWIGARDSAALPAGIDTIAGNGGFLMPALTDLHAHFARPQDLDLYLANGVLNVQWLNADEVALMIADSLRANRLPGPGIHACGGAVSGVNSPADVAAAIERNARYGCMKVYDRIDSLHFKPLLDGARTRGIRSVIHIPRNLRWQQALAARPDAIAHAEEFLYSPIESNEAIDTIISGLRDNRIGLIATLTNYDLITRQGVELPELLSDARLRFYSPVHQRAWEASRNRYRAFTPARIASMRRLLSFQRTLISRADSAGVKVLVGTDAGNTFVLPGYSLHDEMVELVRSGMTARRVLRAATLGAAEFLDIADSVGSIRIGARADLVMVVGDPHQDITNTKLIFGVMAGGRWYPRAELRQRLNGVRTGFDRERRFFSSISDNGLDAALASLAAGNVSDWALNELAYQYWRLDNDTTSARKVFERNRALHPDSWLTMTALAEYYAEHGRATEARTLLDRARAVNRFLRN